MPEVEVDFAAARADAFHTLLFESAAGDLPRGDSLRPDCMQRSTDAKNPYRSSSLITTPTCDPKVSGLGKHLVASSPLPQR